MSSIEDAISAEDAGLSSDWEKIGGDLREAVIETARTLGGEEFAREVTLLAASDHALPDAAAFARLEQAFPGGAGQALDRSLEIASARRAVELEQVTRDGARSGFLQGVRDAFRPF